MIDVATVVDFTGYNRHRVCEWIRFGKLRALALQQKNRIAATTPKALCKRPPTL